MGVFDGLRNAEVFERGAFLNVGVYELTINKCLVKATRKSGDAFIVEFTVDKAEGQGANPVGSKASWFQKLADKNIAFGAIKEFLYAAMGFDYAKDKEQILKEIDPKIETLIQDALEQSKDAPNGKNALKGEKIRCQVNMKKTQKNLGFSMHTWSPAAAA